jgi:putative acetyltransferase
MIIRAAAGDDDQSVRVVLQRAFGSDEEADLVRALYADGDVIAALVALVDDRIVGHVLFSRLAIRTDRERVRAAALAPLAVLPEYQRMGMGSALVREGLRLLRNSHESAVIVLGDPDYYRRFGFSVERAVSLRSRYGGPSFMALELSPGALDDVAGDVEYARAFDPFS